MATGFEKSFRHPFRYSSQERDLKAYALVHLMEGSGYYEDDLGAKVRLKKNDVMVIFPGLKHSYGGDPKDSWKEQFVVFEGELFAALEKDGLIERSRPVVHLDGDARWGSDLYRFIMGQQEGRRVLRPEHSVAELHVLIARLMRQRPSGLSWIEKAVSLLGEELSGEIDLSEVSRELNLGEQTFRKGFKEATGVSPYQFRLTLRLEWARDHLLKSQDKLEVLSEKCGFCDHYHFSRQFKKAFGLSPGAYRRSQGLKTRGGKLGA